MKFENLYIECENLEQRDEVFSVCLENGMKANQDDATHYQKIHQEFWLLEDGIYYLFNEGHWQRGRPDFNGMVEL